MIITNEDVPPFFSPFPTVYTVFLFCSNPGTGSEWIRGNGFSSSAANTKAARRIRRFCSSSVSPFLSISDREIPRAEELRRTWPDLCEFTRG